MSEIVYERYVISSLPPAAIVDMDTGDDYPLIDEGIFETVCGLLNELDKENKFYSRILTDNDKHLREYAFKEVYGLIDKKIKEDKRVYNMTYESELKGRIEVLEELKEELKNDK